MKQFRINGNWESKEFLKRRGDGTFMDVDELWETIHSDEYLQHLVDVGANISHIHFHKGYGLEAEADAIKEATEWSKKLHSKNIKVGVYIGCTIFSETFKPDNLDEIVMKHDVAGWNPAQYFRDFWCYNSPVAMDYFKEVIRVAIEDVKADSLHFDAAFTFNIAQLCHCKFCLEKFDTFLHNEGHELAEIAGYENNPSLLDPPPCGNLEYYKTLDSMKEPGGIAWSLFHAKAGEIALKELVDYAKGLKKETLIFYNGCQLAGITNFCRPERRLEKLELVDMSCTEDDNENSVGIAEDGMPISRFRLYKAGNHAKTSMCCYTVTNGKDNKRMLAEAAAFNYNGLGFIDIAMQQNHKLNDPKDIDFVNYIINNESSFTGQTLWHNVAVLRHHESLLLNQFPSGLTPYVVEQSLFENHYPFSIINSNDITTERLGKFDVIILPDCKSLSDKEIKLIEEFVSNGGHIISIGNTATSTQFNQFRKNWGFASLFNREQSPFVQAVEYDEVAASTVKSSETLINNEIIKTTFGNGSATHLPALDFNIPENHADLNTFGGYRWFYNPYWKAAKNGDLLLDELKTAVANKRHIETNLPRHVGVEFYTTENAAIRLQIVNFDHPNVISNGFITIYEQEFANNSFDISYLLPTGKESNTISAENGILTIPLMDFNLLQTVEITKQ